MRMCLAVKYTRGGVLSVLGVAWLVVLHAATVSCDDYGGVGAAGPEKSFPGLLGPLVGRPGRRQLIEGERIHPAHGPRLPLPKKLTSELYDWWSKELASWNASALGQNSLFPGHPPHHAFHAQLDAKNTTIMLDAYYQLRSATQLPSAPGWTVGASKCPADCTKYGVCNEELSRCDCPIGRGGPDCSAMYDTDCNMDLCYTEYDGMGSCTFFRTDHCINMCNGRGSCISQFCHCLPGYFGSDCSLSIAKDGRPELLAGLNYRPHKTGPKIYVYELPPPIGLWRPIWLDRPIMAMIWERTLTSGHRTARHEEADYFLIPIPLRACCHCTTLTLVMPYLESGAGLPVNYLARKGGRDHILTHAGDWGRCEQPPFMKRMPVNESVVANMTVLQHWGVTGELNSVFNFTLGGPFFTAPCFYVNQDILLPPANSGMLRAISSGPWNPLGARIRVKRTILGFFAGGICGHMQGQVAPCPQHAQAYSLGVRERLFTMFHNASDPYHNSSDFVVAAGVKDIGMLMRKSVFCFAPVGAGWGRRGTMAIMLGCIPVLTADNVVEAWDPFLDWNDFGIRVPQGDLWRMESILRAITPAQIEAKQAKLQCVARHMSWGSVFGGLFQDSGASDAFGTLMAVLAARTRHPGVLDARLRAADTELDDFMACRSPSGAGSSGPQMCDYSPTHGVTSENQAGTGAKFCEMTQYGRKFAVGGAACSGAKDLASCVRPDLARR